MRAWRNLIGVAAGGVMLAGAAAQAAPYWISYEGNDFPENEGWVRSTILSFQDTPDPVRSINDGIFTIDTSASADVADFYTFERPGTLDPEPGEVFIAEWRVRVSSLFDTIQSDFTIIPDIDRIIGFSIGRDRIDLFDARPTNESLTLFIQPGEFHEFRVVSPDMERYEFFIDEHIAAAGRFSLLSRAASAVSFGDSIQGSDTAGTGEWDYLRFGVVRDFGSPEPGMIGMFSFAIGCITWQRRPRTR